jgi:hypothetical protein
MNYCGILIYSLFLPFNLFTCPSSPDRNSNKRQLVHRPKLLHKRNQHISLQRLLVIWSWEGQRSDIHGREQLSWLPDLSLCWAERENCQLDVSGFYHVLVVGERRRKGTDLKDEPLPFLWELVSWVSRKALASNAVVPKKLLGTCFHAPVYRVAMIPLTVSACLTSGHDEEGASPKDAHTSI